MPNGTAPYTASTAFSDYFATFQTGSGATSVSDGSHYGSGLRNRIDQFFSQDAVGQRLMDPDQQYKRDVAFWYGAIQHPGDAAAGNTIKHLFAALYYGGLMVRKKNDSGTHSWAVWNSLQIPIAASLSHTARVLLQLPKMADVRGDAAWQNTWNTFWNAIFSSTNPRMAATHKVVLLSNPDIVDLYRHKYVAEGKGKDNATTHHYINVALGGVGQTNPFSGKAVTNVDGRHGHLYFGYRPSTDQACGGLLVATEQSAPLDVAAYKGMSSSLGNIFVHRGIPDQYGGKHGFGGHNKYSATCGDDWGSGALRTLKVEYYDGLFLDVSKHWQVKYIVQNWGSFDANKLNEYGMDPVKPQSVAGFEHYGNTSKVDEYYDKYYDPRTGKFKV